MSCGKVGFNVIKSNNLIRFKNIKMLHKLFTINSSIYTMQNIIERY